MIRNYLTRFNLLDAYRDARVFFGKRTGYEWKFALASAACCVVIAWAFYVDTITEVPWKRPEIVYVQSWRLDRTDAQIVAQQKIDEVKRKTEEARQKRLRDQNAAKYQRLKDQYGKWL
jgi:hypothetical protein